MFRCACHFDALAVQAAQRFFQSFSPQRKSTIISRHPVIALPFPISWQDLYIGDHHTERHGLDCSRRLGNITPHIGHFVDECFLMLMTVHDVLLKSMFPVSKLTGNDRTISRNLEIPLARSQLSRMTRCMQL